MKERNRRIVWVGWCLAAASILVNGIFLWFLPNAVPLHWNSGVNGGWFGSRAELMVLPVMTAVLGWFLYKLAGAAADGKDGGRSEFAVWFGTVFVFCGLSCWFLIRAISAGTFRVRTTADLTNVCFAALGFYLISSGTLITKCTRESGAGLRTVWSLKSDIIFKRCQRFCGTGLMLAGTAVMIACLFWLNGSSCLLFFLIITAAVLAVSIFYTFWTAAH